MRRKLPPFLHHYRRTHLRIIVTVNVLHIIWRLICRLCLYGAVLWLPVANTPMKLEGGSLRRSKHVPLRLLRDCIVVSGSLDNLYDGDVLTFHSFVDNTDCADQLQVVLSVDMNTLSQYLPLHLLRDLVRFHGMRAHGQSRSLDIPSRIRTHECDRHCASLYVRFSRPPFSSVNPFNRPNYDLEPGSSVDVPLPYQFPLSTTFPPEIPTPRTLMEFIRGWTSEILDGALTELPCAVCAELTLQSEITPLNIHDSRFAILESDDSACFGNQHAIGPVLCKEGITVKHGQQVANVCNNCMKSLDKNLLPINALANGLWVGEVPPELMDLNYVEKLAIARYRHNTFVVCVRMGQRRMRANAVAFAQPVAKFYAALPPPKEDLDECLAILFIGSCKPTVEDYKRTPLILRKNKVLNALRWLKDNHPQYADLVISYSNLDSYPEGCPPVSVMHQYEKNADVEPPERLPVFDKGESLGTNDGQCPFAINALSPQTLSGLNHQAKIAAALAHL